MHSIIFHKILQSFILMFAIFSFANLEIQSAEIPTSNFKFNCQKLASLNISVMTPSQQIDASQCDLAEAGYSWEQAYRKMDDAEQAKAMVYE